MGNFVVTNMPMTVSFDAAKNAKNIAERGLPFDMVDDIDWNEAVIIEDTRKDYGERRFRVFSDIDGRLYAAVITLRSAPRYQSQKGQCERGKGTWQVISQTLI